MRLVISGLYSIRPFLHAVLVGLENTTFPDVAG